MGMSIWRAVRSFFLSVFMVGGVVACAQTPDQASAVCEASDVDMHWLGSWASSQQIPEPRNVLPEEVFADATLRQIVRLTYGGERLRVRISNQYGAGTLRVEDIQIALSFDPTTSEVDQTTSQQLSFNGATAVNIPAGGIYTSDPVTFSVNALDHLVISMYFPTAPDGQTSHPGSRATTYAVHGRQSGATVFEGAYTVAHWFQLSGVEVEALSTSSAIVIMGDSITDGYGTISDSDTRWPDYFVTRIQSDSDLKDRFSVLNHGIGGNNMLHDGLGPSAVARYDEDVLDQSGATHLFLLEGVNDLGGYARNPDTQPSDYIQLVADLKMAFTEIAGTSRAHGIIPIGGTIMPFGDSDFYHPSVDAERARQDLNEWIRNSNTFDHVVDFDEFMRDPDDHRMLNPVYDSGDHLHPSIAGYEAMAAHIPLEIFETDTAAKQCLD